MTCRFGINLKPGIRPNEQIIYSKKTVWFMAVSSLPTYRLFFSLPLLMDLSLSITNQRILLYTRFFIIFKFESDIVLSDDGNADIYCKDVSVKTHYFFGPYVELRCAYRKRPFFCSDETRIRIYTKEAEAIRNAAMLR